MIIVHCS